AEVGVLPGAAPVGEQDLGQGAPVDQVARDDTGEGQFSVGGPEPVARGLSGFEGRRCGHRVFSPWAVRRGTASHVTKPTTRFSYCDRGVSVRRVRNALRSVVVGKLNAIAFRLTKRVGWFVIKRVVVGPPAAATAWDPLSEAERPAMPPGWARGPPDDVH